MAAARTDPPGKSIAGRVFRMHVTRAALDDAIQLLEGRGNQRGTGAQQYLKRT
jgi:hypothetical protein